jgi:WD40 repeat protein
MKFNAFISYSHSADGKIGPALQKALVKLAKPWYKMRALRIFRDETSLSASPHLWKNIIAGLMDSEYFILLASPMAASSKWVQKEIEFWLSKKSVENIIIALTEGEIVWDDKIGDFDWQLTTAVPTILKGAFEMEPLYIDFRASRKASDLSLQNPGFKNKVVYVAATVHKVIVEDFVSEDIEQHKRTLRIRNGAVVALSFLLIISIIAAWKAWSETNIARKQTAIAIQQRNIALSRFYYATALQKREEQYDSAIFYGIKAYQTDANPETKNGFYDLMNFNRNIVAYLNCSSGKSMKIFSAKENRIICADQMGIIKFINAEAESVSIVKTSNTNFSSDEVAIDPAGTTAAFSSKAGIVMWDVLNNRQIGEPIKANTNRISAIAFNHSGKILAAAGWDGQIILWNVETHQPLLPAIIYPSERPDDGMARGVMFLSFSPNDSLLVTTGGDNNVILWQVANGRQFGKSMKKHGIGFNQVFSGVEAAAFTEDGNHLATGGNDKQIIIWDVKKQQALTDFLKGHNSPVTAIFFDEVNHVLVSGSESGEIIFWNLDNLSPVIISHAHNGQVTNIIKSPVGRGYISSGKDGKIVLLDQTPASDRMAEKYQHALPVVQPAARGRNGLMLYSDIIRKTELAASGNLLAAGSDDGVLVIWDTKTGKEIFRKKLFTEKIFSIEFDHNERYLAAGGYTENLFLYDLKSGNQWELKGSGTAISSICFNKTGSEVAAGTSDGHCYVWDLASKTVKSDVQYDNNAIALVAFINDDKYLLVCNTNGLIKMGDQNTKDTFQLRNYAGDIAINHAKNIIAFRQKNQVQLLKITGNQLTNLDAISLPETDVAGDGLFINNAGTVLAAVTGNTIGIYDTKSGKPLLPRLIGGTSINSVAMDNNGEKIAADVSGNVQVWNLDFNALIEKGWKITGIKR